MTESKYFLLQICMMEREGKGASALDETGNSYAVFDNQWVTYDSPSNAIEKVLINMLVFL